MLIGPSLAKISGSRYNIGMDWKLLIAQLQAAGMSQAQIAEKCSCVQSTISELATIPGREPRYSLGVALTQLHKRIARKAKPTATA